MSQDMCVNCGAVLDWTEEPQPLILLTVGGYYAFCGTCKDEECVALDEGAPYVTPMSLCDPRDSGVCETVLGEHG
jgi:hypothetical protein